MLHYVTMRTVNYSHLDFYDGLAIFFSGKLSSNFYGEAKVVSMCDSINYYQKLGKI